ncbi:MAG: PQQ-dependent sugar dehydrogenase [Beijerinckiaceae bacterium]
MRFRLALFAAPFMIAAVLARPQIVTAQTAPAIKSEKAEFRIETVARGLENPWGFDFLPDGRMIVTERPGRLRIVSPDGQISQPLNGLPRMMIGGQGGLLDVTVAPDFGSSREIFFTFSEPRESGRNGTSVGRARLNSASTALEGTRVIFQQQPSHGGTAHFGSRLVFDRSGHLFVALGDRYSARDQAQNPANHIGKIIRMTRDGAPAPGNPGGALDPHIWSIGHRNVQGAALHPETGTLWTAEHGARGGDEINQPQAGKNYGWPIITYGVDYSGAKIGEGTQKAGMEQPVYYWDPSIAPSGLMIYTGAAFPAWRGHFFVGALAGMLLARLEVQDGKVVREERLLRDLRERIRAVKQGPDGFIYLITDSSDGRILRIRP